MLVVIWERLHLLSPCISIYMYPAVGLRLSFMVETCRDIICIPYSHNSHYNNYSTNNQIRVG